MAKRIPTGIGVFFIALGILSALRLMLALIPAPLHWIPILTIFVTVVFVAIPILALFRAAETRWTPRIALGFLIGGVVAHGGLLLLAQPLGPTLGGLIVTALAQVGLICWCVGLGALLGTMLKDRNLLIPVTIFLGCFDLFLVFTPVGPTRMIMQAAPKLLPTVGYAIPHIVTTPTAAPVDPYAVVGPADFIFMAMFFIALFRFQMRARETFNALVPTLLAYLILSAFLGAIPLLPPIAIVVLAVNWREFKMNAEEKLSTAVIAAICIGLIVWGATRPKPQAAPSRGVPAQAPSRSAG